MAFITPKTDWEATDPLTYVDFNRIKNNLEYLNEIYNELFEPYVIDFGADMTSTQLFNNADVWNKFEDCIEHFQRSGIVHEIGERSYYKSNGRLPNYTQLNRIEQLTLEYSNYDNPVESVSVVPQKAYFAYYQNEFPISNAGSFTAQFTPSNPSDRAVSWDTDDYSIATIDKNGLVSLKKGGTTSVTVATHDGGFVDTATFYSIVKAEQLTFPSFNIYEDSSYDLQGHLSCVPSTANFVRYEYQSSDTSVLTVNSSGVLTGVAQGSATLTINVIQDPDGTITTPILTIQLPITVREVQVPVTGITLNRQTINAVTGNKYKIIATVIPSNASDKSVTWTSSDASLATVDAYGIVTIGNTASETVVITATTNDGGYSASCVISIITGVGGTRTPVEDGSYYIDFIYISRTPSRGIAELITKHAIATIRVNTFVSLGEYTLGGAYLVDVCMSDEFKSHLGEGFGPKDYYYNHTVTGYVTMAPSCTELKLENQNDLPADATESYIYFNSADKRKAYFIADKTQLVDYITRTIYKSGSTYYAYRITTSGTSQSFKLVGTSTHIRPLCTIEDTVKVFPTPTEDGVYIIDWLNNEGSVAISTLSFGSVIRDVAFEDLPGNESYIPVESLSLPHEDYGIVGTTGYLLPTVTPSNATDQNFEYKSHDTDVATVSSTGLITFLTTGHVTISVTSSDGPTDYSTFTVYGSISNTNLVSRPYASGSPYEISGITFIENSNGTLSVSGTSHTYRTYYDVHTTSQTGLGAGTYIFGIDSSDVKNSFGTKEDHDLYATLTIAETGQSARTIFSYSPLSERIFTVSSNFIYILRVNACYDTFNYTNGEILPQIYSIT